MDEEQRAVTNKPWDGSAARWPDAAAYCSSCLIDLNTGGGEKSKALCKLPVKEPNGDVNANALRAAFAALRGGRGGVDAPAAAKQSAMRKVLSMMRSAGLPMPGDTGVRSKTAEFFDLEAAPDGSHFSGYAAVFDERADLGEFTESVARGAFRKVLTQGTNVPMLFDHNAGLPPLATTRAGTLQLAEDAKGLRVEARIGNHFVAEAVREMISRGEVTGMSYGFVAGAGNSTVEFTGDKPHRTLTGFKKLLDVSPTWDPAYEATVAELRNLAASAVDLQPLVDGDGPQADEDGEDQTEPEESEQRDATRAAGLSVAARKRALQFYVLTTGGIVDET